jgi:predicted enzyme related to lactoylglutathione lyase
MAEAELAGARLGSAVLGSADPDRLSAWYRAAFTPSAEGGGSVVTLDGSRLIFDRREDVGPAAAEPGRVIINIYVEDIAAVDAHLKALEIVERVRPVEPFAGGLITTLKDPDGNYVNVVELRNVG